MLVLASSTVNALAPTNLAAAEALVARVYRGGAGKSSGGDEYGERLAIGRKAQLGDDLVYRLGLIGGGSVDTALTYGEYELEFFATLVDRALDGGDGAGHSFVDVGSGCGRLVLAASELWPALARVSGVESVAEPTRSPRRRRARRRARSISIAPTRTTRCAPTARWATRASSSRTPRPGRRLATSSPTLA